MSNTGRTVKITKHKLVNGCVRYFSTPKTKRDEHCYLCGEFITTYTKFFDHLKANPLPIDDEYLAEWYDVVDGDIVYHLCSPECREVFKLAPLV